MPQYFGKLPVTHQPWTTITTVQTVNQNERDISITSGDALLTITILAANLVRVRLAPKGEFIPRRPWAIALNDTEWPPVDFEVQETASTIEIMTEQMRVFDTLPSKERQIL